MKTTEQIVAELEVEVKRLLKENEVLLSENKTLKDAFKSIYRQLYDLAGQVEIDFD